MLNRRDLTRVPVETVEPPDEMVYSSSSMNLTFIFSVFGPGPTECLVPLSTYKGQYGTAHLVASGPRLRFFFFFFFTRAEVASPERFVAVEEEAAAERLVAVEEEPAERLVAVEEDAAAEEPV